MLEANSGVFRVVYGLWPVQPIQPPKSCLWSSHPRRDATPALVAVASEAQGLSPSTATRTPTPRHRAWHETRGREVFGTSPQLTVDHSSAALLLTRSDTSIQNA